MSAKAIARAIRRFPALVPDGVYYPSDSGLRRAAGAEVLKREQALLFTPDAEDQFRRMYSWCVLQAKADKLCKSMDSYGWKHVAEREGYGYAWNGVMIAAALAAGIQVEPVPRSPCVYFGLKRRPRPKSVWAK